MYPISSLTVLNQPYNIYNCKTPINNTDINPNDTHDWFDSSKYINNQQSNFACFIRENICSYKNHFYVSNSQNEFHVKTFDYESLLGYDNSLTEETQRHNVYIYEKRFQAIKWENETQFNNAKCTYNSISNHLIFQSHYTHMLLEMWDRILVPLYEMYKEHFFNKYPNNYKNIKIWGIIRDYHPTWTMHKLFFEPFTQYNIENVMVCWGT